MPRNKIPPSNRFFNWMVVALSYYGISYSAGSIGDDLFVSNILIALVGKKSHTEGSRNRIAAVGTLHYHKLCRVARFIYS